MRRLPPLARGGEQMTTPPPADVHMSDWWGVPTSCGTLVVYHHIDSEYMKPIVAKLREHFTAALGSILVNAARDSLPGRSDEIHTQR